MNTAVIKEKLQGRTPGLIDVETASSVLIPLVEKDGELHLLFEKRANHIRQGGEVCFPGGRMDPGERAEQTALRETEEELGLPPHRITVLGQFDTLHNYTGVTIHTFVGQIAAGDLDRIVPRESEVEEVFCVPLSFFLKEKPFTYHYDVVAMVGEDFPYHLVDAPNKRDWSRGTCNVPIWNYRGYTIWGLTARIVVQFLKTFFKEEMTY